jgi:DNA-binding transcriptional regulator GbsR (MarR family)
MKNLDVLLEGIRNIENQLVENEIIEDGDLISEALGELKEKLYREMIKEDLQEFHSKLHDLVDEYHHAIYLNDKIFKGIGTIEVAVLDELNRDK